MIHLKKKDNKVPTKFNLYHKYRTVHRDVGKITYEDSIRMFKKIGGGPVETDAQFAKMLLNNFGPGIYLGIYWMKGMEGFRTFIYIEIQPDFFRIIPKRKKKYKNELMKIGHLRKMLETGKDKNGEKLDDEDLKIAKEDMKEQKEEINWDKDMEYVGEHLHNYLTYTKIKYKNHSYEPLKNNMEVSIDGIW